MIICMVSTNEWCCMCDVICRVHINECTLCVPLYVHTEASEEHWHIPLLLSFLLSWDRKLLNLISIPPCWGYRHIYPCPDFHLCPGDKNSDSSLCTESVLTHCAISLIPKTIFIIFIAILLFSWFCKVNLIYYHVKIHSLLLHDPAFIWMPDTENML